METLSGKITLREIFLDNGNWWKFWVKNKALIRVAIIVNVLKLILCRTPLLGHHYYECPNCGHGMKVPHSCKSRFCPPCGKKATDDWMKRAFERLPNVTWQHITFTMPESVWELFWLNRHLFTHVTQLGFIFLNSSNAAWLARTSNLYLMAKWFRAVLSFKRSSLQKAKMLQKMWFACDLVTLVGDFSKLAFCLTDLWYSSILQRFL